jgi:hypothetical protein
MFYSNIYELSWNSKLLEDGTFSKLLEHSILGLDCLFKPARLDWSCLVLVVELEFVSFILSFISFILYFCCLVSPFPAIKVILCYSTFPSTIIPISLTTDAYDGYYAYNLGEQNLKHF